MHAFRHSSRLASPNFLGARRAFTLIELVVVIVILAILASLTLSGLNGARQRAKIDKTRSTIRKLHEIVIPIYESYVERRITPAVNVGPNKAGVNATSMASLLSSVAGRQVFARRFIAAKDFPDVLDDAWDASYSGGWGATVGVEAPNPRYQRYAKHAFTERGPITDEQKFAFESAECLQMIVVRSGYSPDAVEHFRSDEIGDVDADGLPEFVDGWGRPISFIRWPTGFQSPMQSTTDSDPPDPMDPLGVTRSYPHPILAGIAYTDRAVVPLIYSGGPNNSLDANVDMTSGSYGLTTAREALGGGLWQRSGWINPNSSGKYDFTTTRWPVTGGNWAGWKKNAREASDNITNHDLVTK